jgi:signal recognition particle receptor subunit beta
VIDSSDRERIQRAADELHKVVEDSELANAPILVFANKQDIDGAMTSEEIFEKLRINQVIDSRKKDICF